VDMDSDEVWGSVTGALNSVDNVVIAVGIKKGGEGEGGGIGIGSGIWESIVYS